jgi:tetratricopeptide (TPR) repeat protein
LRSLNVKAVIEGTFRYTGNAGRLTLSLIDGTTDTELWSKPYTIDFSKVTDVIAAQVDVATNIARELSIEFSADDRALLEKPPTSSPEAYALWLRAFAAPDITAATALLDRAVEVDPGFAAAFGRLAYWRAFDYINMDGGAAVRSEERPAIDAYVRGYAERALALDPSEGYAHAAIAITGLFQWRWSAADRSFNEAEESSADPRQAMGHHMYLLAFRREFDSAEALAQRARRLSPNDEEAAWYGQLLLFSRRYDEAAAELGRQAARFPNGLVTRIYLAAAEIARGNGEAAIAHLELSERLAEGDDEAFVFYPEWAYRYSRVGRHDDAQRLFTAFQQAAESGLSPGAGGWALACLAIGEHDEALEWLEAAAQKVANHEADEGFWALMNLRMNLTDDPLLKQEPFASALERIKGD